MRDDQADTPEYLHRTLLAARLGAALNPEMTGDPEVLAKTGLGNHEPFQTVVEAVTFVARDSELHATEDKPDPLTRCIDVLTDFHRSYRVIAHEHIAELTYERLHPTVLWFRHSAFETETQPVPAGTLLLENRNLSFPRTEPISPEAQADIIHFSSRLAAGDPFSVYAERRLEADMEIWTTGRMGESVIQTAIAAEVLFDALLGLMMWEEYEGGSISLESAAKVFSSDLTPRLRNQYAKRLGGQWSFKNAPMKGWFDAISGVRNSVVHGGARPDKHSAADAMDALLAVEKFVGDRLAERWQTYPRTAWMFLGTPGFTKRGRLRKADEWLQANDGDIVSWVREYQSWREQVNALVTRRRQSSKP